MKHLVAFFAIPLLVSGCVTYRDAPTQKMVEQQLQKTKKVVTFSSALPPQEIEDKTLKSGCGPGDTTLTTLVTPVSGTYIPVVNKYKYSVDHGAWGDGSRWIALKTDGMFHGVPAGLKLVPRIDGGTDVSVIAADARKVAVIKQRTEDGTLFCHWQEFDYPYD